MAFKTFAENFLREKDGPVPPFAWPTWLAKRAWPIDELLETHHAHISKLAGQVDVLAGGPPCQGFSMAGRRLESDPRNQLFEKYIEFVHAVKPKALILENVPGMRIAHSPDERACDSGGQAVQSYYDKLKLGLEAAGYEVLGQILDASQYGVPQKRSRLIVLGLEKKLARRLPGGIKRVFSLLEEGRLAHLAEMGLPAHRAISASDAISDLRSDGAIRQPCIDPESRGPFEEIRYAGPKTAYQRLMHLDCTDNAMNSMRLARHGTEIRERFAMILAECRRGVRMDSASLARHGLKKQRIHPMAPNEPAPTITTLPDDVLHYAEPRILTVRECARLQGFPDWFRFRGKFTTGGHLRTKECPRYTQVGNAVPPPLGRMIGLAIVSAIREASTGKAQSPPSFALIQQRISIA
ncbi:cytosine-specific methyltransferase [Pseudoduganella plicata]|nr:cytosine-specific methyltransferase [Pseudoduganella plicata]